jgi:uncharacterized protein (TIGR02246 family)
MLQRLIDIEEIKQLKARFFRVLDTQDWDGYERVFSADAHMEVPEGNVSVDGRANIATAVSGFLVNARTVHHGHTSEIEITGPDSARGVWAMCDYVEFPEAADGSRIGLRGYGHYTEEYVREDGHWRIKHLHLSRLRIDPLS